MAILNPIISKFTLASGVAQNVYSCPNGKSHAIVDLSFFKDDLVSDALIAVAISTSTDPQSLTSVDFFLDDLSLTGVVNAAELNKLAIGAGENLFIKVLSGPNVVVRVTGMEENNPKVAKAGRLGASTISTTSQTQVFNNNTPNAAYTSCSVTIFNTSATTNATIEAWISTSATPADSDKVLRITLPYEDTTILENLLLAPNERIFVRSSQAGNEFFINGIVVSQ